MKAVGVSRSLKLGFELLAIGGVVGEEGSRVEVVKAPG